MKRRMLSALCCAAVLAAGVAGCGGTSENKAGEEKTAEEGAAKENTAGDGEEVSLRWFQGLVEYADQVKEMAKAYEEEHPNVHIEVEVIGDDYTNLLKAKASSDDMPDIFMTGGFNEMESYKEYMMELSGQPYAENIVDAAKGAVTLDGKVYGFPFQMSGYGVVYNKAIFEENDIDIPETVPELEEVCKTLQEKGITPFSNQFKDDWLLGQLFNYGFANMDDTTGYIDQMYAGEAKMSDSEELQEVMQVLDLMLEYGQDKPLDASLNEAESMFALGESAMMFEGIWTYDALSSITPDMELGLFALPITDDAADTVMATNVNGVLHVPSSSEHQDVANDVLNWMVTSDAGKEILLKKCQVIPAMKGMEFEGENPLSEDVLTYINDNKTGIWSWNLWPNGFYNESGKILQEYISEGNGDKDSKLSKMDDTWTKMAEAR